MIDDERLEVLRKKALYGNQAHLDRLGRKLSTDTERVFLMRAKPGRDIYPFKIEYLSEAGKLLYTVDVTESGKLRTPGSLGHSPIKIRFTWANGDVTEETVP
jgi:hypothetical protein